VGGAPKRTELAGARKRRAELAGTHGRGASNSWTKGRSSAGIDIICCSIVPRSANEKNKVQQGRGIDARADVAVTRTLMACI
jgi:hypothetical protein